MAPSDNPQNQSNRDFKPTVFISTKKENDEIIISVSNNGNGISQEIKTKSSSRFLP
ncbi:hypothetical protein [Halpernia sp. GG3]